MNLYDFLIIYLSGGAPLGVCYFLLNRKRTQFKHLWLKTFFTFIFWLPFAYRLLRKSNLMKSVSGIFFGREQVLDANIKKNIYPIQNHLEKVFLESNLKLSIYEVREIFERYAGLTLTCQFEHNNSQTARTENKIFEIAGHQNAELAAACLHRRNRNRLTFHQTEARRDFLNLLAELFDSDSDIKTLHKTAIEFVTLLNDAEAQYAIEKIFDFKTQTADVLNVKNTETAIWKSEIQKPLLTKPISTRLKALTITTTLRGKD